MMGYEGTEKPSTVRWPCWTAWTTTVANSGHPMRNWTESCHTCPYASVVARTTTCPVSCSVTCPVVRSMLATLGLDERKSTSHGQLCTPIQVHTVCAWSVAVTGQEKLPLPIP